MRVVLIRELLIISKFIQILSSFFAYGVGLRVLTLLLPKENLENLEFILDPVFIDVNILDNRLLTVILEDLD